MKLFIKFVIFISAAGGLLSFVDNAHQNLPEDALLYIESYGSNQQRWAFDYLKAKAGGRYIDSSSNAGDYSATVGGPGQNSAGPKFGDVYGNGGAKTTIPSPATRISVAAMAANPCFDPQDFALLKAPPEGPFVGVGCGIIGISRAGGVGPDYFRDTFWHGSGITGGVVTSGSWKYTAPDFTKIGDLNFSSAFHFINLVNKNYDSGSNQQDLVNNVYNDYDGYSYNGNWNYSSFLGSGVGKDYGVAIAFNNAQMSIDVQNCTACTGEGGIYTLVNYANPPQSYKQNRSTTPVGTPGSDGTKIPSGTGSNYNCYSDMKLTGNCPDEGWYYCFSTVFGACTSWQYRIPNTTPGGGDTAYADQDWIIYEPADNAATFFYNEVFLEKGTSYSGGNMNSLQPSAVTGNYYTMDAMSLRGLGVVMHWAGDINQPMHIWSTLGNNHSEFEAFADSTYGRRTVGGSDSGKNYENFANDARAFTNSRVKRYYDGLDEIYLENAWITYNTRLRSGFDVVVNTDTTTRGNMLRHGVNSAIATMALIFEKAAMDLRKCRTACTSSSTYQMKY